MQKLRAITYGLCALGFSSLVISSVQAFPGPSCFKGQRGGFYAQLEGFYARSNDSFLDAIPFAFTDEAELAPDVNETDLFRFRDRDKDWGFRAAVGYDFPDCYGCCNYGFSLEYTQFNQDDHHATPTLVDIDGGPAIIPALDPLNDSATDARVRYETDYYTADLLAHKNMVPCCNTRFQIFGGARYVNLRQRYRVNYNDFGLPVSTSHTESNVRFRADFDGIGPRVGANFFVPFACYFGLTTEVAGSLIFGENDSDYDVLGITTDITTGEVLQTNISKDHHDDTSRVVPALSGKVGLAFNMTFRNCSSLTIEAGWRGDKYFKITDVSTMFSGKIHLFGDNNVYYSDFDFNGPYATVSFHV